MRELIMKWRGGGRVENLIINISYLKGVKEHPYNSLIILIFMIRDQGVNIISHNKLKSFYIYTSELTVLKIR